MYMALVSVPAMWKGKGKKSTAVLPRSAPEPRKMLVALLLLWGGVRLVMRRGRLDVRRPVRQEQNQEEHDTNSSSLQHQMAATEDVICFGKIWLWVDYTHPY